MNAIIIRSLKISLLVTLISLLLNALVFANGTEPLSIVLYSLITTFSIFFLFNLKFFSKLGSFLLYSVIFAFLSSFFIDMFLPENFLLQIAYFTLIYFFLSLSLFFWKIYFLQLGKHWLYFLAFLDYILTVAIISYLFFLTIGYQKFEILDVLFINLRVFSISGFIIFFLEYYTMRYGTLNIF